MELHTYAKRKASKKWSIEQKRKLVAARIKYDDLFFNQPPSRVLPWKKVLELAQLNDYNVFFVRKQWSVMIAKYKQYKETRLGNIPSRAIDDDIIQKITQEWEFFEPLHRFMARRTTNLHSYALIMQKPEQLIEPKEELLDDVVEAVAHFDFPTETMNVYSSDTNETEFQTHRYTDHDFYSKNPFQQTNYSADASEDTQESAVLGLKRASKETQETRIAKTTKLETNSSDGPLTTNPEAVPSTTKSDRTKALSERDKYYRHKRRFNRRLEHRFDAILNVFGQIVKVEYPSIDVSPLLGTAVNGSTLLTKLFSDEDSIEDMSTDDELNSINGDKEKKAAT